MILRRAVVLVSSLTTLVAIGAACGPAGTPPAHTPPPAPAPSAPAPEPVARAPVTLPAPRPAPPSIDTPMAGEPGGAKLVEARLVASSCEDYAAASRERAKMQLEEMRKRVDASYHSWVDEQPQCWADMRAEAEANKKGIGWGFGRGGMSADGIGLGAIGTVGHGAGAGAPAVRMGATTSSRPTSAKSKSDTNNQVEGVDEADLVKSDGTYVYLAANGALRIVEAMKPRIVSVTKIPGNVKEMFVEGDRAVVYASFGGSGRKPCTYGYDCQFAGDGSSTKIVVLDIRDRAAPKTVREITLSGSLMAARRIGTAVHTVVADGDAPGAQYKTWPEDLGQTCGNDEKVVRAKFAKLKADNEKKILAHVWFPTIQDGADQTRLCGGLLRTAMADGQAFTTVASFDMKDDKAPVASATLESRPGAVFASADALYVSVVHQKRAAQGRWYSFYPNVDEVSEIHEFTIGANPKETKYAGSGVVPGHVLNQFSMDSWYGYLRVATTRGHVPDPKASSSISVLARNKEHNLVRVGAVENIAPGEDIRAVRFDDDRGYVVTFKKTDPLFVVDLHDPAKPAILGELKIPGFSTYIHRIDPDHLMSIGFDANDHGSFAYFDGVILQLFDVTNPTDPRLLHKEKIGTRGSSSEAATDHLAFNYYADRGLLAVPMTICEGGGDGRNGDTVSFSGLLVYDVSIANGFKRLGGVDHSTRGVSCNTWWSNANSAVKRSLFLDDLVYSIATDRVKVQRLGHFGLDLADLAMSP